MDDNSDSSLPITDVIFYNFNETSEMAQKMIQRYPPNKKQQKICKRLHVPLTLWSFYKAEILKYSFENASERFSPIFKLCTLKRPVKFNLKGFNRDKLNRNEKRFIFNHKVIEKIRQHCTCVAVIPSSLSELCIRIIIKRTNLQGLEEGKWKSLLPTTLYQKLSLYKQKIIKRINFSHKIPEYKAEIVRFFNIHNTIDFFKEKDRTFSKDFIIWFQNDFSISFTQFKDLYKLILIYFTLFDGEIYWECLNCAKENIRRFNDASFFSFSRIYEITDVTFFDNIKNRRKYWCIYCKRVPLFQILSLQECNKQYVPHVVSWTNNITEVFF